MAVHPLACRSTCDDTTLEHEDRPGTIANAMLRLVNELEVRLPWALRPPVGSSLIGVFRCRT